MTYIFSSYFPVSHSPLSVQISSLLRAALDGYGTILSRKRQVAIPIFALPNGPQTTFPSAPRTSRLVLVLRCTHHASSFGLQRFLSPCSPCSPFSSSQGGQQPHCLAHVRRHVIRHRREISRRYQRERERRTGGHIVCYDFPSRHGFSGIVSRCTRLEDGTSRERLGEFDRGTDAGEEAFRAWIGLGMLGHRSVLVSIAFVPCGRGIAPR